MGAYGAARPCGDLLKTNGSVSERSLALAGVLSVAAHVTLLAWLGPRSVFSAASVGSADPARHGALIVSLGASHRPRPTAEPGASISPSGVRHKLRSPAAEVGRRPSASGIPGAVYFRRADLDRPPMPLTEPLLDFPEAAAERQGKVRLDIFISPAGRVDAIEARASDLPEPYVAAARAGFQNLSFAPGIRRGEPVPSRFSIEIEYEPGMLPH